MLPVNAAEFETERPNPEESKFNVPLVLLKSPEFNVFTLSTNWLVDINQCENVFE